MRLAIDADSIMYNAYYERDRGNFNREKDYPPLVDVQSSKIASFYNRIETLKRRLGVSEALIIISDKTNFRYKIDPNYKGNRKSSSKAFSAMKETLRADKNTIVWNNYEADDVVSYFVRHEGYTGVSIDKDLLNGCTGHWYDSYHKKFKLTCAVEANRFNCLQTLMGDPSDGIKGIAGVGVKTATKMLNKYGYHWQGIIRAYNEYGLSEEDAYITYRLINVNSIEKKGDNKCILK